MYCTAPKYIILRIDRDSAASAARMVHLKMAWVTPATL
jgi:hypothetical protein